MLAAQTWIRKLLLARDLKPDTKTGAWLEALTSLEELTTTEWAPIDYAVFKHLKELVLFKGTSLEGLDKIKSLDSVYLAFWDTETLPNTIARLAATRLWLSASRKLKDITPVFAMKHLTSLTLQDLPKLEIRQKALKLDRLTFLNVEKTGWTDFSPLHSKSLRDLELFCDFQSLKFISQLDKLETVHIWNCLDGDMNPALKHPTLKSISFDKDRKHYTHKEEELEALMKRNGA